MGTVFGGVRKWQDWKWRLASVVLSGASASLLGGCPIGAELEDPMRFADRYYPPAAGGSAGTGGMPGGGIDPGCDYATVLMNSCAMSHCHGRSKLAKLDLRPDEGLVARLYDVPALHEGIDCSQTAVFQACARPTEPAACLPFNDALLVDSSNVENSWILKKINGTSAGCGDPMPYDLTIEEADRACLEKFIRAVAAR